MIALFRRRPAAPSRSGWHTTTANGALSCCAHCPAGCRWDDWQADPDIPVVPSLTWLIACAADENWKSMGSAAARWLRDLTEDDADG